MIKLYSIVAAYVNVVSCYILLTHQLYYTIVVSDVYKPTLMSMFPMTSIAQCEV